MKFSHIQLFADEPGCLTWQGEDLVDWRSATVYGLDGSTGSGAIRYRHRFDAAVRSPCGRYVVLYERFGTKGIVLREGRLIREIDRSFYFADAYEFPVALFDLPDGRPAIAHCPSDYNQLEINLVETGQQLTTRSGGVKEADFFHSGLSVDPSGQWLMSAGWIWHPYYDVCFYPIAQTLEDPSILGRGGSVAREAEIPSATFIGPDLALLASDPRSETFDEDEREPGAERLGMLGLYRPSSKTWLSRTEIREPLGRIFAVDDDHVLSLFRHPKLVHTRSGCVVDSWPEINCGDRTGCICVSDDKGPVTSWDPIGRRLAIATTDIIHVLAPSD